jgi:hypothetical protein
MTTATQKTHIVARDVREEVLSLFGSVANAAGKLQIDISYGTLNQGLRGLAIRPSEGEAIEAAWREWKQHYVRGVALGVRTDLNNFERVPQEETDDLADQEIEEWTRRLRPKTKKQKVNL